MPEYHFSEIRPADRRALKEQEALLAQEGIARDQNLDYSVGLYDEDYRLAATGSAFKNTLRCMAVDHRHQGEGLMNQIVSHLTEYELGRGYLDLFLYTKCSTARFFGDLGFYEIARVPDQVVFMENRRDGFENYLKRLKQETESAGFSASQPSGAVVMNANPFTLGHQYLAEEAAKSCGLLHLFVVSEDVSLVPFSARWQLVKEGTAHIPNLVLHPTGSYMISNATFPSYFLKDSETVIRSHAALDIAVFQRIAQALSISCRFVGEEPRSQVTGIYNQVMAQKLEQAGMGCRILPRRRENGIPISASAVRQALKEGRLEELRRLVPASTWEYFSTREGRMVAETISRAAEVRHY